MEEFIKTLTEQIRCAKARDGVKRELSNHIIDQAEVYEQSGMEHSKAVERAVQEMGDPVEIGMSMDRIHCPQIDWRMLLITALLGIVSILCMMPVYGVEYALFRQSLFLLMGFAVIAIVYFIDYHFIGWIGAAAYIAMTILLLIGSHYMRTINGRIPEMSILVYLYVPLYAGILYQLRMKGWEAVLTAIAVSGITFVAVVHFSSTILVAGNILLIMIVMLFVAIRKGMFGANKKRMTTIVAAVVSLLSIIFVIYCCANGASFRMKRIWAFFHRNQYKDTINYIYQVIDDILRNAKFIGTGSTEYFDSPQMIPQMIPREELVPLYTIYVYGILAGALLLALLSVLVFCSVKIVRGQKNQLGFLISMSCFLVILVNCFEGILMNIGLFPVTTVMFPFLTRGGSTMFVYAVLIGLLLSVHRYEKVYTEELYTEQPRWRINLKVEKR